MTIRKLSAGDIIEARCTKCREVLNHRIVAMVEEKVVRVECNTCHGVHNFHAPPQEKPPKALKPTTGIRKTSSATPRASKRDPVEIEREEWLLLEPSFEPARALPYELSGVYQVRHLVRHPLFGLGVVKQLISPNKMQVLFRDGIKLLRCQ